MVHVCSCLMGAPSTGSQPGKQMKSPWLRLLLWHHGNAADALFRRRCRLLIGWHWSCMLKFEGFWSTTAAVATTPSRLACLSVYCLSLSLSSFSLPLIHGCRALFLDFDCQELLNQIRCLSVSLTFSPPQHPVITFIHLGLCVSKFAIIYRFFFSSVNLPSPLKIRSGTFQITLVSFSYPHVFPHSWTQNKMFLRMFADILFWCPLI